MKYLSLDIGKKRIGIALSLAGTFCKEYKTLDFTTSDNLISDIKTIITENNIDAIIIGLPKNMDGSDSEYTLYVREIADKIKTKITIPINLEDERLTSAEAERQLQEMGLARDEIKKRVDQYAAKLILEQYLENK